MNKSMILSEIKKNGIIAIIRTDDYKIAIKTIESIIKSGISTIEVTMSVPNAIEIIKEVKNKYSNKKLLIGAGSVLDPETARTCLLAGAEYIVSPNLNEKVIQMCNRYQKVSIPGVMTVTETVKAMEYGADIIKLFPAYLFDPSIVKSIKGPLPQANLMPTGGIKLNNVKDWIEAGSIAVGVGSSLSKFAKSNNYNEITKTGSSFKNIINKTKANMSSN